MPYAGQNIGGVTGQLIAAFRQKKTPGVVESSSLGPSMNVQKEVVAQSPLQDSVQGQNLAQNVLPNPPVEQPIAPELSLTPENQTAAKMNVLKDLLKQSRPRVRNRDKARVKTILDQGR